MAPRNGDLQRFQIAMQRVYDFPTAAVPSSTPWTPPPASAGHRGRYLWTDAFGVLNFLTLYRTTEQLEYLGHAKSLVSAVHNTLGRTRDLSSQLPGASPENPLGGGLRIGKEEDTGPDRDGQYHHYLTGSSRISLWMFALNRLSVYGEKKEYNDQAIALAKAIHPAFVYNRGSPRPGMYWKVSTDLQEPLVRSEGNLDPIDGLAVFKLLQKTDGDTSTVLKREIEEYQRIVDTKWQGYTSTDALDLGMALWTTHYWGEKEEDWARGIAGRAEQDCDSFWGSGYFKQKMGRRLAFREFGLAMGLQCGPAQRDEKWRKRVDYIVRSWEVAGVLPERKHDNGGGINAEDDLAPITCVMYAAALVPLAFQVVDFQSS